MHRPRLAFVLTAIASAGCFVIAGLHAMGFDTVLRLAREGPPDLPPLVSLLWIQVSADFLVTGVVVAIVAFRPGATARTILIAASLIPLATAGLQLRFLGFLPSTAMVLALGLLMLGAAAAQPATRPPAAASQPAPPPPAAP